MAVKQDDLLFELLRQTKLFNDVQLDQLALDDRSGDASITESVVRLGMASEEDFLQAAARVIGLDYVDVSEIAPAPDVIERLPARSVYQYGVIPVSFDNDTLTIATSDPFNLALVDGLRIASGYQISPVVCTTEKIGKQARKFYGVGGDTFEKMMSGGRYEVEAAEDKIGRAHV